MENPILNLSAVSAETVGFCTLETPGPAGFIIFGASGNLARRKLLPSLFNLASRGLLSESYYVTGVGRSPWSDEAFREQVGSAILNEDPTSDRQALQAFLEHCRYVSGHYEDAEFILNLGRVLDVLDHTRGTQGNRVYYFALPPTEYAGITQKISQAGLTAEPAAGTPFRRLVYEKPYGHDWESAVALDHSLHEVIKESQIYRMDHYLGKDTVQNILMFRFANSIFESVWNRRYIDQVQIVVAESLGFENRVGYYDQSGQLRDMFQSHLMQLLALVAMEPPASFQADRVRDEKVKVLRAIRPLNAGGTNTDIVRGQYAPGLLEGQTVPGYLGEVGVPPNSRTETYVGAKLWIDNWRWQGVPFYIRTGKRLARKVSEIIIVFKRVPVSMFFPLEAADLPPTTLRLRIQPEEGIDLTVNTKLPGMKVCLTPLDLKFRYRETFGIKTPCAYERLLLDILVGDQTLFWRHDDVEAAWALLTPVLQQWGAPGNAAPLSTYPAGSWGPAEADGLLEPQHQWRLSGRAE
ncbi:MAG: glucose-6-phosphate dehydrogenase [Candidatus Firestonebacteria bacterium]|nr:glucose-6-phosphate dehydrogenase [Candidatus Firestonebacteria bacterium]